MNPRVHLLEAIQLSEIEAVRAFFVEYEGTLPFDPGYQVFDDEISGVSGPLGEPFIWRRCRCQRTPRARTECRRGQTAFRSGGISRSRLWPYAGRKDRGTRKAHLL